MNAYRARLISVRAGTGPKINLCLFRYDKQKNPVLFFQKTVYRLAKH